MVALCPTNWNLSASKLQNFICNFTNGLIACINFYGVKYPIHTNSSNTSVNDVGSADSASNIGQQPIPQIYFVRHQRYFYDSASTCVQFLDYTINDGLFMHNPAKNNVIVSSATKKTVQQIADIAHDHFFCFFHYLKRIGIPTPVTSRKTLLGKSFFNCWLIVVLPTPIVPPIKYSVFIPIPHKFRFVEIIVS